MHQRRAVRCPSDAQARIAVVVRGTTSLKAICTLVAHSVAECRPDAIERSAHAASCSETHRVTSVSRHAMLRPSRIGFGNAPAATYRLIVRALLPTCRAVSGAV